MKKCLNCKKEFPEDVLLGIEFGYTLKWKEKGFCNKRCYDKFMIRGMR